MHRLISPILAAAFVFTTAAAGQNRPRLLAYYFFNDQNATPKYDSSQIPYNKLTHLIHVALQAAPAGDGDHCHLARRDRTGAGSSGARGRRPRHRLGPGVQPPRSAKRRRMQTRAPGSPRR